MHDWNESDSQLLLVNCTCEPHNFCSPFVLVGGGGGGATAVVVVAGNLFFFIILTIYMIFQGTYRSFSFSVQMVWTVYSTLILSLSLSLSHTYYPNPHVRGLVRRNWFGLERETHGILLKRFIWKNTFTFKNPYHIATTKSSNWTFLSITLKFNRNFRFAGESFAQFNCVMRIWFGSNCSFFCVWIL